MPREKKQPEVEQEAGAPEWMVTFSDCMTLLLTFFVLLLSFSSFSDQDDFRKMNSAFANQVSFGAKSNLERESITTMPRVKQDIRWGSEKPTLSDGKKDRFKKQTEPTDFSRLNTFLISSNDVFFANGVVISLNGREVLTDLSLFLKEFPSYFVIVSESGPQDVMGSRSIGFNRAWVVLDYLTVEKGLDRQRLSISAEGTAVKGFHLNSMQRGDAVADGRMLEIVLLGRSF